MSRSLAHGRSEFMDHLPNYLSGSFHGGPSRRDPAQVVPGGEWRKNESPTMKVRERKDVQLPQKTVSIQNATIGA